MIITKNSKMYAEYQIYGQTISRKQQHRYN